MSATRACTCKEGPHRYPWLIDNACDRTCKLRDPACVLHGDVLTPEMFDAARVVLTAREHVPSQRDRERAIARAGFERAYTSRGMPC